MQDYFIDTHCHLHDQDFFPDHQQELLENAYQNNVLQIITIGTSHADSLSARDFSVDFSKISDKSPHLPSHNIFWTYGIHPSEHLAPREKPDFTPSKPIAIGEVGLDYHYEPYDRDAQILLFEEMIDLSLQHHLPLVFHVREAFDDFYAVLKNFPGVRGVVHSFSDNRKNLFKALDYGFYIGVNGLATYSTLPLPPLDHILLETDAPFLSPIPHRGKPNQPAYTRYVGEWLADKLDLPLSKVALETTKNAIKLFNLPDLKIFKY